MLLQVYAVHDAAVGAFNQPLFFRSRGECLRSFEQAVRDGSGGFGGHPEHFSMYYIGTYNSDTALLEPVAPERVCSAVDFMFEGK